MKLSSKKILLFYLHFILSISCFSQVQWEKITDQELMGHIYSLQFNPHGIFYAASANGFFRSSDCGTNWDNLFPTEDFLDNVLSFLLITENEIFIGAMNGIFYSSDGGTTWSQTLVCAPDFIIMDNEGIIYTGFNPSFKSYDLGQSWTEITTPFPTWTAYGAKNGYLLAGTTCGIHLSEDKGENWTLTGFFNCGDISKIQGTKNDSIIYIVGADRFRGIQYSTDFGYTWTYVEDSDTIRYGNSIVVTTIGDVYFGSHFYGVFKYNINNSGLVGFNDGFIIEAVSALAIDDLGYLYAGSDGIYKTNSPVDSIKLTPNTVDKYLLGQNYPNPFNSSTTINYTIKLPDLVNISIYDILGKRVAEVVDIFRLTGQYKVIFNANQLSSGVYIYQLRVNDFVSAKKMIVLK